MPAPSSINSTVTVITVPTVVLTRWTYQAKAGARNTTSPDTDDYNTWCVNHLCRECTARGFQLKQTVAKEERIKRLIACDEMKDKLMIQDVQDRALLPLPVCGTVRTKDCMCCLIYVFFHCKHIVEFIKTGDSLTKYDLDTRKIGLDRNTLFWKMVHEDYTDQLTFEFDAILAAGHIAFDGIYATVIVEHAVVKLESMWKELKGRFLKAKAKFTQSGTANHDFGNFSYGQADVFYLWTMLQTMQEAISFVDGGMLDYDCLDLMISPATTATTPNDNTGKSFEDAESSGSWGSYRTKKLNTEEKENREDILQAMHILADSNKAAALDTIQNQEQSRVLHKMELEKRLMESLEQVMIRLERLRGQLQNEKDKDEILEIEDMIVFYKQKRKKMKAELRSYNTISES